MNNNTKLNIAFGEEDGKSFAAIMWPEELGSVPFEGKRVKLMFLKEGIALFEREDGISQEFHGLSTDLLVEINKRNIVLVERKEDDYVQYEVYTGNSPF